MPQVDINADHDSFTNEVSAATNYGSNTNLDIKNQVDNDRHIFIKWSDLSSVPSGMTIVSATFYIYCQTAYANADDLRVYICDADWDESTIAWTGQPSLSGSSLHTFDFTTTGWKNCGGDLTTTFANWYSGSSNNYGLVIQHNGSASDDASAAISSEDTNKPYMRVVYESPAHGVGCGSPMMI